MADIETTIREGVEYRRTTRKRWDEALLVRDAWRREGFTTRVDVLSEAHARREPEPGGHACLVRGSRQHSSYLTGRTTQE